eukprot:3578372-Rhodomonas_salina.1
MTSTELAYAAAVSLAVHIYNPSLISIHLGAHSTPFPLTPRDLSFALHKTACVPGPDRFGTAFLHNTTLQPGWNAIAAFGTYEASPSHSGFSCGEQFLSEFVNNQVSACAVLA